MINYKDIDFTENSFRQYYELLNKVFVKNRTKTVEYLKWEYLKNPSGQALGTNAFHDSRLIGHYVSQPIVGRIGNNEKKGLFALHVATSSDYRGRGIFYEINHRANLKAKELGFTFIIGVANDSSTKLYHEKLGFDVVSPLEVKIGLGKPGVKSGGSDPISYARIWNNKEIEWRFSNPNGKYYYKIAGNGIFILGQTNINGVYAIMTYLENRQSFEIRGKLSLLKKPHICVWYGFNSEFIWNDKAFINLPDRFKPSPLNLIFKCLDDTGSKISRNSMVFNPVDHDAF